MENINNNIPKLNALKAIRITLDLSLKEFADKLNTHQSYISEIESGKRTITPKFRTKLKEVYNIKLYESMELQEFIDDLESSELTHLEKYRFILIKTLGIVNKDLKEESQELFDNYLLIGGRNGR